MKVVVEGVHLNISELGDGVRLPNPFWYSDTDTYTIHLLFIMRGGYARRASVQTYKRTRFGLVLNPKTSNFTKVIKSIHSTTFPDIEFVRKADKVHNEPGIMRIFAQSEKERQEFTELLGQDIWYAPYDSRERLMEHLAVTAETYNTSVHGIATTGSFVETE